MQRYVVSERRYCRRLHRPVLSAEQHLRYIDGGTGAARALPAWARLMARLGATLAEIDPAERRLVVGVTLPTRAYAAALAAAAHVLRRDQLAPMEPSDADAHFELLRALPEGTAVKLVQGGKVHDGRLLGIEVRDGTEFLMVAGRRGMTRLLPKNVALSVRPADKPAAENGDLRSRRIAIPPLLAAFVDAPHAANYATQTRLDCVIAGTLTMATADLTAEEFTADSAPDSCGCLQDLARVRGVAGASSASRAHLVAGGASEEDLPGEVPWMVVFDGGRSYARLGHAWTASHHLVVIDRSQVSAEGAAEALNFAYFERSGECELTRLPCPSSMELLAFEAVSR
jgi:hypothetical protein